MNQIRHFSVGLAGRIFAILLLAMAFEFGVSTLLYERASRLSVHEDEAHRLAESLAVAVKVFGAAPPRDRHVVADQLSTERYIFTWRPTRTRPSFGTPGLSSMRLQVTAWEPSLAATGLRLHLKSPGRSNVVLGTLRLPDGTWLEVIAPTLVQQSTLALNRVALALVPAIGLTIMGVLLVGRILRPIRDLVRAAGEIGGGSSVAVVERGPTEIRRLARAFNEMQTRIHGLIENRTQALAAVGHDLRTPISRLRLRADLIPDDALRRSFSDDLMEIDGMLGSLLAFFGRHADPERPEKVDLAVTLASMVDAATDEGANAVYRGPDHCEITLRRGEIKRAASNLLSNALHYGGNATLILDAHPDHVMIVIEDDGPGIPEDRIASVMQPFVRLDEARARNTNGLGLGLAIVEHAVSNAGGSVNLANRPGGGLRACITLPRVPAET